MGSALLVTLAVIGVLSDFGVLDLPFPSAPHVTITQIYSLHDENHDGINDTQEIIDGARAEVKRAPTYRSGYYTGGYPPETEGVCTDVIWRALKNAGYDLKTLVDSDIQKNLPSYERIDGKPDPNIDFRRVPNLEAFFRSHATVLTTELKPGDVQNLEQWQGGDIVLFGAPSPHIGIVSDKRRPDGIPLLIHNAGTRPKEEDALLFWDRQISHVIAHVRWPKETVQSVSTNE